MAEPDQIASENPTQIGIRGRKRSGGEGQAGVITVHICLKAVPTATKTTGRLSAPASSPSKVSVRMESAVSCGCSEKLSHRSKAWSSIHI